MDHKAWLEKAYGVTFGQNLYGNGHINKTYLSEGTPRILLQEINTAVFRDPKGMMDNILAVTGYLQKRYAAEGKDPTRYTLTVVPTLSGAPFLQVEGCFYRAYAFIENTVSYDIVTPETLEKAGYSFGKFCKDLSGFPAETLCEVIPNFHNTPARFAAFREAVEKDAFGRAKDDSEEIGFYRAHEAFCHTVRIFKFYRKACIVV